MVSVLIEPAKCHECGSGNRVGKCVKCERPCSYLPRLCAGVPSHQSANGIVSVFMAGLYDSGYGYQEYFVGINGDDA